MLNIFRKKLIPLVLCSGVMLRCSSNHSSQISTTEINSTVAMLSSDESNQEIVQIPLETEKIANNLDKDRCTNWSSWAYVNLSCQVNYQVCSQSHPRAVTIFHYRRHRKCDGNTQWQNAIKYGLCGCGSTLAPEPLGPNEEQM